MFECFRCTKPDRKEFSKIAIATAIGFGIMVILTYPISLLVNLYFMFQGFIGFFVKLIHIPINNIIVGA